MALLFVLQNHIFVDIYYWYSEFMKAKKKEISEPDVYILPSDNEEMKEFVNKFKVDMMENIVNKIKFAIENNLPIVEVFTFKKSPFVVTITNTEFIENLEHINKFYREHEIFELCPKVEELLRTLKK